MKGQTFWKARKRERKLLEFLKGGKLCENNINNIVIATLNRRIQKRILYKQAEDLWEMTEFDMCCYQSAPFDGIPFCSHGLRGYDHCTIEKNVLCFKAEPLGSHSVFLCHLTTLDKALENWIRWGLILKRRELDWMRFMSTTWFWHFLITNLSGLVFTHFLAEISLVFMRYFLSIHHDTITALSDTEFIICNETLFSIPFIEMRRLILILHYYGIKRNNLVKMLALLWYVVGANKCLYSLSK